MSYDFLYNNVGVLWPYKPGRMVVKAIKRFDRPGLALDLGSGDGKHILYLERRGWIVDGIEISEIASAAFEARCRDAKHRHRGSMILGDVSCLRPAYAAYNLVICYGLMHCILEDAKIAKMVEKIKKSLISGGLVAFAALNNKIRIPENHGTDQLALRNPHYYLSKFSGFKVLCVQNGYIYEDHEPVIPLHKHGVTWALFQKIR